MDRYHGNGAVSAADVEAPPEGEVPPPPPPELSEPPKVDFTFKVPTISSLVSTGNPATVSNQNFRNPATVHYDVYVDELATATVAPEISKIHTNPSVFQQNFSYPVVSQPVFQFPTVSKQIRISFPQQSTFPVFNTNLSRFGFIPPAVQARTSLNKYVGSCQPTLTPTVTELVNSVVTLSGHNSTLLCQNVQLVQCNMRGNSKPETQTGRSGATISQNVRVIQLFRYT